MDPNKKLTPAEIVILAAGVVVFVFSFLPFYKIGGASLGSFHVSSKNVNAWSSGLFPVATLIPIFGVIMAAQVAIAKFTSAQIPARVLTFTWEQVLVALGIFAALLAVCYLIVDKGGADFGFGFYLVLVGAIGLAVGAVMLQHERTTRPGLI
jgi:hypothetical protein